MTIMCTAVGPSKEGPECTDVHFIDVRGDDTPFVMTVWHLPDGNLYGEW